MSWPFPHQFLSEAMPDLADRAIALYYYRHSAWPKHIAKIATWDPLSFLIQARKSRPFLYRVFQKVKDCDVHVDWHFLPYAVPSDDRHKMQTYFKEQIAQPFSNWLMTQRTHGNTPICVRWHSETNTMTMTNSPY